MRIIHLNIRRSSNSPGSLSRQGLSEVLMSINCPKSIPIRISLFRKEKKKIEKFSLMQTYYNLNLCFFAFPGMVT